MSQILSFILNLIEEEIPDFFSLLFWTLRENGCMSSSDYIFQDETQEIHEIRYEVISTLTKGKVGPGFSNYIGTYITLKLSYKKTNANYYEIRIYVESLEHEESLQKPIPWRRNIRRLNKASLSLYMKNALKNMKTLNELNLDELQIILSNIEKALSCTYDRVKKGPKIEYHTGAFFNTHKDFLEEYYEIEDYTITPAHSKVEGIYDEHICVSKISKEFSVRTAERNNYSELAFIGMLFGLLTNRHFSLTKVAPKQTRQELSIPNFKLFCEPTEKSKMLKFASKYPKGELLPISEPEHFGYNNIKFPSDTTEIIQRYKGLVNEKKEIFENSLRCLNMSMDLYEEYPTFSFVSLISALDGLIELSDSPRVRDQEAKCPHCKHTYLPVCPECGKQYGLLRSNWKVIYEFIKDNVSLNPDEKRELKDILEKSYYKMRSAAVHNAKLRGLEYDTEEKIRYFLPSDSISVPSVYKLQYYYNSLKEITVVTMINWLKKQ